MTASLGHPCLGRAGFELVEAVQVGAPLEHVADERGGEVPGIGRSDLRGVAGFPRVHGQADEAVLATGGDERLAVGAGYDELAVVEEATSLSPLA